MTVIYLQCQNPECKGLGTRTRTKEKCQCCGQTIEKKAEVFTCNLCGGEMKAIPVSTWEWLAHHGDVKGYQLPRDA